MYTSYIWDFDGTLFDTYPGMALSLHEALQTMGVTVSYDEVYKQLKQSMGHAVGYYSRVHSLDAKDIRQTYSQIERRHMPDDFQPFADTLRTLQAIYERGGRHFVFTHRNHTAVDLLRAYNMLDYFAEVVTSEYGFTRKPSPEAFQYLVRKHELNLHTTLAIGDRLLDIQAANNAGLTSCLIKDAFNAQAEAVSNHTVDRRQDILDL